MADARCLRRLLVGGFSALALLLSSCTQAWLPGSDGRACCPPAHVDVCRDFSMKSLANDLDTLEDHIERFGSVVAMQPSVWGEARLTKHRQEVEIEMAKALTDFKPSLQGSLSRSDQAYFANAMTLGMAVSGRTALRRPASSVVVNSLTESKATGADMGDRIEIPGTEIKGDPFAAFSSITRNALTMPDRLGFAGTATSISLEPTIVLDQKFRYLNHLNELRRINEGDDTADSPGYALNLIRIPVSVLPGKKTREGHAAEITMTIKPVLSDELLPTTFRNLVIADLVNQIGVPLTEYINSEDLLWDYLRSVQAETSPKKDWPPTPNKVEPAAKDAKNAGGPNFPMGALEMPGKKTPLTLSAETTKMLPPKVYQGLLKSAERTLTTEGKKMGATPQQTIAAAADMKKGPVGPVRLSRVVPATKVRRAMLPFAPSQIPEVYGEFFALQIAVDTLNTFLRHVPSTDPCVKDEIFLHLPDVQGYLQEELTEAYRFLADPIHAHLWNLCTRDLAAWIRGRKAEQVEVTRAQFVEQIGPLRDDQKTTVALAWAILVESALLNERLIQDMREAAAAKGCPCITQDWLPCYLPVPPPEARRAFNDYVACRWPIQVFALDPVTEQQNIADSFARRREMQLAMSLAFVSGRISARNMTNYARRIEHDMQTIDLNGTAVGFAHGPDTFGWRFYPRFQTPEIEGNLTAWGRDLMLGGPSRDADLHRRRLEPGMRECLAIVLMPSFVPYATVDVSSNWFSLTHPKLKKMDTTYALRLSKTVKAIEVCGPNVGDADCYRGGDFPRLLQRAKQLEARLPLQTMTVQIPYENTLGGFAMFNSGITDLAPELTGWYGAPSLNIDKSTTVFLMGDHFSVHQTRVIAGGVFVNDFELLSRQVLKAVIPAGAKTLTTSEGSFVDVHIATPYGVTPHLLIPMCPGAKTVHGVAWKTTGLELAFVYQGLGIVAAAAPIFRPLELTINEDAAAPAKATHVDVELSFKGFNVASLTLKDLPIKGNTIVIDDSKDKRLEEMVKGVFARFGTVFGPEATNPPTPVAVSAVITFKADAAALPNPLTATNDLTISWVKAPK